LEHCFIQTQICDEFFKTRVFFYKLFEFSDLICFDAAVLLLGGSPSVIGLDGDAKFLGYQFHPHAFC